MGGKYFWFIVLLFHDFLLLRNNWIVALKMLSYRWSQSAYAFTNKYAAREHLFIKNSIRVFIGFTCCWWKLNRISQTISLDTDPIIYVDIIFFLQCLLFSFLILSMYIFVYIYVSHSLSYFCCLLLPINNNFCGVGLVLMQYLFCNFTSDVCKMWANMCAFYLLLYFALVFVFVKFK